MRFLIADDHELFLQGLEFILRKEFSQAQIVTANSYTAIFEVLKTEKVFDLIVTDLAMPGAKWLDAIEQIHNICPEVPIIVISAVFEREILQKTFDIGVSGYLSKSFPNNIIISAINLVLAGGMYIPPEVLQMGIKSVPESVRDLLKNLNSSAKNSEKNSILTPRQMDVLRCLNEGLSNKQIAYKLGLSEGTVKIHLTLLMRALKVTNRLAAVREAIKRGMLEA